MLIAGVGDLPVFKCRVSRDPKRHKSPATTNGFYDATCVEPPENWPLVGVRTGVQVDCLDVDPAKGGDKWYSHNFDALPLTRAHESERGGVHLLFKSAPGLASRNSHIAPGIDVKASKGYFIWWPRQGHPFEAHPLCEWPDWLLKEAMGNTHTHGAGASVRRAVLNDSGILSRIDPIEFRAFSVWFRLMTSCFVAGVRREEFVDWSTSDPLYEDAGDEIRRMWDALKPNGEITEATLFRALRREPASLPPVPKDRQPLTRAIRDDLTRIANWLSRQDADEGALFYAACRYGELRMQFKVADDVLKRLLLNAALRSGLPDKRRVLRQIRNGLRVGGMETKGANRNE
jgi:hypothetical protein